MKEKVFRFTVERPITVLILSVLFVLSAASGAQKLVFKSDYRVFFSEENPQLTAFETMQDVFNKSDNVAFIVSPKDGNVFTAETLSVVKALTGEAWQIPYSTRVDSVTNFQHTLATGDDLIVEDLVDDVALMNTEDLARVKEIALSEPLLKRKLISLEGHVTVVNTTVQLPGIDTVKEIPEVVEVVRAIATKFMQDNPNIEIRLSGLVMLNNSFAESSIEDNATLVPVMFGLVIITLLFLLRTFSGTLSTVVIIVFSIVSTMGLAGWTGFFLTGPSSTTPIMVLTLAVADCVHILSSMIYEINHGKNKKDAIISSLRLNYQPVFLTSATTAIGFLSLNFSDSPPFQDLGNMVATGVMLAFVFSVTTFPALLSLLPVKAKSKHRNYQSMEKFADLVIANRKILLPVMALLMSALVVLLPNNELNDDNIKYFDQEVPIRQATDYMQEHLSGMTTIEISVGSGEASGINNPDYIQFLGSLTDWLRSQPETDHVSSLSDTLKRLNKNMHGDDPAYYRLPENRELAAQYLLLYEMSLPYGLDLNNQIDVSKSATRVVVTLQNLTNVEQLDFEARIYQWFAESGQGYEVQVASPTLMFSHIGQRNIVSMLIGTTMALVLISILLGFALRSVRLGLVSLIPNIAPAAMGFGVWYLIDGQVGLALSVVAGMTLGIVVDFTVHYLSKYLHARRHKNLLPEDAVRYSYYNVGRALLITTFVLVSGFMVLAQSSFKLNSDMGLLTAITIAIALIVDFLFLPPLLMAMEKRSFFRLA